MEIVFSRMVMFFMPSSVPIICLPAVAAQVPLSMTATVRFCRLSALISDRYAAIFG